MINLQCGHVWFTKISLLIINVTKATSNYAFFAGNIVNNISTD